jgi:hypothetical protein
VSELSAWEAWSGLPDATRHEVSQLAEQGRAHSDADVAAIALRWARTVLDAEPSSGAGRFAERVGRSLSRLADLASGVTPDGSDEISEDRARVRWAQQVVAASEGRGGPRYAR